MGSILTPAIDAIRKIDAPAATVAHAALVAALAVKANGGLQGYRPQHGPNGGECALTLGSLPVLVRYELTFDHCGSEIAEVVAVGISGHEIEAGDFAADIRAEWGSQCMQLRGGL